MTFSPRDLLEAMLAGAWFFVSRASASLGPRRRGKLRHEFDRLRSVELAFLPP